MYICYVCMYVCYVTVPVQSDYILRIDEIVRCFILLCSLGADFLVLRRWICC